VKEGSRPIAAPCSRSRLGHQVVPVEEEVVVVEDVPRLLRVDVRLEERAQLVAPRGAPGERGGERCRERALRVDRVRIDRETGAFLREPRRSLRQAEPVAREVQQVLGVGAIEDGERRVEADRRAVETEEAIGDAVERPRPWNREVRGRGGAMDARCGAAAADVRRADPARAGRHLARGATREGEKEDTPRIRAAEDRVGDAVGERLRLAGARARDDEERAGHRRRLR